MHIPPRNDHAVAGLDYDGMKQSQFAPAGEWWPQPRPVSRKAVPQSMVARLATPADRMNHP